MSAASFGESEVHIVWRVESEAGMPVLAIVPAEEVHAVGPGVFE